MLTLLARPRRVYNRATREYDELPETLGRVAKKLGKSIRTVRRWKNEGVEPADPRARARLQELASEAAALIARKEARDRQTHPRAMKLPIAELPVPPVGHRRDLREYGRDARGNVEWTGRYYKSSWRNYSVKGWRFSEVLALVTAAWRQKKIFQFIYWIPPGGRRLDYDHEQGGRVSKATRSASSLVNPYSLASEADVAELVLRYLDMEEGPLSRRMLFIGVDDKPAHGRGDDEGDEDEGEE